MYNIIPHKFTPSTIMIVYLFIDHHDWSAIKQMVLYSYYNDKWPAFCDWGFQYTVLRLDVFRTHQMEDEM